MATPNSSMESSPSSKSKTDGGSYHDRISELPKVKGFMGHDLYLYQGTYHSIISLPGLMRMQDLFKAQSDDIIIASFPKSGTTWMKALVFAIINRTRYDKKTHPLLHKLSHECIEPLELRIYGDKYYNPSRLDGYSAPRLFSTHANYMSFKTCLTDCGNCKIIYIWRDPKDVFVSFWHFMQRILSEKVVADVTDLIPSSELMNDYDLFCRGLCVYGPIWDHVLSYWKASMEDRQNILFIKYEDLKREPQVYVKKLAEFVGESFTVEEEENGKVQEIVDLCSFEFLSNLEVNRMAIREGNKFTNDAFYRKGKVGDWKNYLTLEMAERLDNIVKQKFNEHGLLL